MSMRSESDATSHAGWSIYHANGKCTGSALRIEVRPSCPVCDGGIYFKIAPQKTLSSIEPQGRFTSAAFSWEDGIAFVLHTEEVAMLIMVLLGLEESILDGKGIFISTLTRRLVVRFCRVVEPILGYRLEVCMKMVSGEGKSLSFRFSVTEATALRLALEGAMSRIAFG